MTNNPGHLPADCQVLNERGELIGTRPVHVRLFNGYDSRRAGQPPWPSAATRAALTNWRISKPPHPFEIQQYEAV